MRVCSNSIPAHTADTAGDQADHEDQGFVPVTVTVRVRPRLLVCLTVREIPAQIVEAAGSAGDHVSALNSTSWSSDAVCVPRVTVTVASSSPRRDRVTVEVRPAPAASPLHR
ncbi:MAG: hypothetical protein F4Y34_08465 [Gammaproteobacteria bacterium]|nr:hypothetical protein [Gammaproteobacteria bacterium]MYE30536.1 hypothetical protein [Gammaproteobacteria bacterium]